MFELDRRWLQERVELGISDSSKAQASKMVYHILSRDLKKIIYILTSENFGNAQVIPLYLGIKLELNVFCFGKEMSPRLIA